MLSPMAKDMDSLPDDAVAEESMRERSVHRAERMTEISHSGDAGHGGRVAELVKTHRPA